jgi:hypothetical protein
MPDKDGMWIFLMKMFERRWKKEGNFGKGLLTIIIFALIVCVGITAYFEFKKTQQTSGNFSPIINGNSNKVNSDNSMSTINGGVFSGNYQIGNNNTMSVTNFGDKPMTEQEIRIAMRKKFDEINPEILTYSDHDPFLSPRVPIVMSVTHVRELQKLIKQYPLSEEYFTLVTSPEPTFVGVGYNDHIGKGLTDKFLDGPAYECLIFLKKPIR